MVTKIKNHHICEALLGDGRRVSYLVTAEKLKILLNPKK